jgi:HSP20 family protein
MQYRRISIRYSQIVAGPGLEPLGDPWRARPPAPLAEPQWRPPADLYETATALVVKAEVGGMDEEDFRLTLYDDALVVEGTRPWEGPTGATCFHAVEVRYGPFRLVVPLPASVDRERVAARYERGFLSVTLPKAEVSQP